MMYTLANFFYEILKTPHFLLTSIALSFAVKIYLLKVLIPYGLRPSTIHKPWIFLLGVLIGSMFGDIAWMVKLARDIHLFNCSYATFVFCARISWGFLIFQYQALALFIESLTHKKFILQLHHKLLFVVSISFASFFFFTALFDTNLTDAASRNAAHLLPISQAPLEMRMMEYVVLYVLNLLVAPGLIATFLNLRTLSLPKILKKQIRIVLIYFMCPYIMIEAIQATQYVFPLFRFQLYPIVALSTILIICAIAYCILKIIGLRFLNSEHYVRSRYNAHFLNNFKNLLEQLCRTNNFQELTQLTQTFFNTAFGITPRKVSLIVRHQSIIQQDYSIAAQIDGIEAVVENFLYIHNKTMENVLGERKIVIHNELEFSNFYHDDTSQKTILLFLESIHADVFLPIYEKNKLIAYIIIEQSSRKQEFYGDTEQDEMLVFARYLGNIINLLQHRNLTSLLYKEKELKEELYRKNQEIGQYKESIQSFLRDSTHNEIGIIFYKNRRFIFGNKYAKQLINVNLTTQDGHPITKTVKKVVQQVLSYKTPHTSFTQDNNGKKIVLYAAPTLDSSTIILMVYYPDISDILTRNITLLKDPTTWDYLLYLETTQSGKLINQLIPDSGQTLLNFKIDLLKLALSKKAILLEVADDDLMPTVEIIHHISLKKTLHTITLTKQSHSVTIAAQLFGINPIFGKTTTTKPLLSILDETGTLCIKNIEYLDLETQNYLAEFLKYGVFKTFKGDEKFTSTVRIICSTQRSLSLLVQQGSFSSELFNELSQTSLKMPSLSTLPEQELRKLTESFTQQALKSNELNTILELTDKEKSNIAYNRPVSLHDLKTKIQEILVHKSKKNMVYQETQINPTLEVSDPELLTAAKLGKKALRDPQMMAMLWNKFRNQNTIALFLGVNRSSINRRCKRYELS